MPAPEDYNTRSLGDFIGHDFGASKPVALDQSRINSFAAITGDDQWIHVDVERATKESPFGGPIAHGFLTLSLLASSLGDAGCVPADARGVVNYGLDRVRFLAPVPAGAEVSFSFRLIAVEPKGPGRQLMRLTAEARIVGTDKTAVFADVLALVIG